MMQLNLTGKDIEITDALKAHITDKFANVQRHFGTMQNAQIILRVENEIQVAEANVHIDHTDINATAKERDMYIAVDALMHKLMALLTKHKERLLDKRT